MRTDNNQRMRFWTNGVFIGTQIAAIIYLSFAIYQKVDERSVLGAYTTTIHKESLILSVLDSTRTFWEHRGGEIEKAQASWLPYSVTYRFNNDGLNSTHDYYVVKPDRMRRIMTLGDSFTFGAWVNTEENYSSILEVSLNNRTKPIISYEVLNLGEIAYDMDFIKERYARRGQKYDPDIIILFLPECDLTEISGFMSSKVNEFDVKMRSDTSDSLKRQLNAIDLAHNKLNEMTDNNIEQFQYSRLIELLDSVKKPVILLTDDKTSGHGLSLLRAISSLRPHVYFEVLPTFDRLPDMHPSKVGHTQIAAEIMRILEDIHFIQ